MLNHMENLPQHGQRLKQNNLVDCRCGFIKDCGTKTPEFIRGIQSRPRELDHRSLLKKRLIFTLKCGIIKVA